MTNAERVKQWMSKCNQEVDHNPSTTVPVDVLSLRFTLEREEHRETMEALSNYVASEQWSPKDCAHLAKEIGDKLVVAYGFLIAMGLDPDKVFEIVQDENDGKIDSGTQREDGKVIVDPETKAKLKKATEQRLLALLQ